MSADTQERFATVQLERRKGLLTSAMMWFDHRAVFN